MTTKEVIEDTIKYHPLIDFCDAQDGVHWALCPCGFATRRFSNAQDAHLAFEAHIAEEIGESIIEIGMFSILQELLETTRLKPTETLFAL